MVARKQVLTVLAKQQQKNSLKL